MCKSSARIFEQSMGARNQVGIGFLYRPARLQRLVESISGLHRSLKIPPQIEESVGRLAKATFIHISIHLYSSNVVTLFQTQLGK
jgi:hypothetical protein